MFLGIVGLLMIFLIVYLLISGKSNAMVIFVIVPIIAALLCGFAPAVIFEFLKKGVGTTMSTAVLFLFSIVYFGIMNDVGLFDPLIKFLVKRAGSNIVLITVATGVIATVAHLDGTTAGTKDQSSVGIVYPVGHTNNTAGDAGVSGGCCFRFDAV